jgi:cell division septation protein DedD
MSDIRAGKGLDDGDRLPWLEAVDEEDDAGGPSAAKLIAFVVVGLAAIGLIVGGLFWMLNRGGDAPASANEELIAAPAEDYKIKPEEPGGMKVEGKGDTAFAASAGEAPKGTIDMAAVPEQPVTALPKAQPQPQPAPGQPKQAPGQTKGREIVVAVAPSTPAPAQQPAARQPAGQDPAAAPASGPAIQLGAFSSQASANAAWKNLAGRFKYLEPLTHNVVPVQSGGKTLYRLRASGSIQGICGRLRVAGENCVELN